MKTIRRTIYSLGLALMIVGSTFGQSIDQERMERDLKIAENILGTLSNSDRGFFSSRNVESNYVPDYGVIFSLPQSSMVYATSKSKNGLVISGGSGASYSYVVSDASDSDDDDVQEVSQEKFEEELDKQLKEQMTLFLVDYADLIGQLKPTDRIMVNVKNNRNHISWLGNGEVMEKNMGQTAEIVKSDLIAMKSGKASREATIAKIKFTEVKNKMEKDLELFSSIFSRLYEPDMSNTYYASSRNINYERLDNLGAIFSMRVYSSSSDDEGKHTIRTTGERGLTQAERNAKVNAMYPEFEKNLKQNIIDYGRTIKSLKPSEMLIIKVRLTDCNGCDMPQSIELSVKGSVLSDFDTGKLTREKAVNAIVVKRIGN